MKPYIFVYKTNNDINKKIYIGVHTTTNLDDGYLGSGDGIRSAIKKYGKNNFHREILKTFDSIDDAYEYERLLVNEAFVNRCDTYNQKEGGEGGQYGLVICRKDDQTCYTIHKSIFDKNDSYHGVLIGKIAVQDNNGKCFSVDKNDPRYLSGKLVGVTKGLAMFKNSNGDTFQVSPDDKRVTSGELVGIRYGTTHSNITKEKMSKSNVGMIPVRDKDGNKFRVAKDDLRYMSGELVFHSKGQTRTLKLVKCPHCGKEGKGGNMTRYHFSNCKLS